MKKILSLVTLAAALGAAYPAMAADPVTYKKVSSIKTDGQGEIQAIQVDAAARRAYSAREGSVEVIDLDSNAKVGHVAVAGKVGAIALATDLGRGFAASTSDNSVTVFDLKTLATIKVIRSVASGPTGMLYEPKSKRAFVSGSSSGKVTAIAADAGEIVGEVSLGGKLRGIAADTRGNVFVADEGSDSLRVIDSKTLKAKGQIATWPAGKPTAMVVDDKERRIYVATASGRMVVIDPDIGQMVGYVPTGKGDAGIAAQFGANRFVRLFVPTTDGQLTVIQNPKLSAFLESKQPSAGVNAGAVAVDTKTGKAYVAGKTEILVFNK